MQLQRQILIVLTVIALSLTQVPTTGQAPSFAGHWSIGMSASLPAQASSCVFDGTVDIHQTGPDISGSSSLSKTSGPDMCPKTMMANLQGNVNGGFFMGVLNGALGSLNFEGSVLMPKKSTDAPGDSGNVKQAAPQVNGTFLVGAGPFEGLQGGFSAVQIAHVPVPVLTDLGIGALAALLMLSTLALLRRSVV